ncbi:MAG TPA: hypothetical protein VM491_01540 [Burkholderiaceae bacterium]|nr:hypothetical protein [Burkholderiaceae bacterium]
MYVARFSYSVLPVDRERAIAFIRREVDAARQQGLQARLLVPLTRGPGGAALQFEVVLDSLDRFDRFRERGIGSDRKTGEWMRGFSAILISPPEVELLRIEGDDADAAPGATGAGGRAQAAASEGAEAAKAFDAFKGGKAIKAGKRERVPDADGNGNERGDKRGKGASGKRGKRGSER